MSADRLAPRVADLLADAHAAQEAGERDAVRALAAAVLALAPGNAEAAALLDGSARRCQMTLMFCDVVGSTALADTRDPEEVTAILRHYRTVCSDAVDRFGGTIEDRRGDGLLIRFGYPLVHEDDARRAVLSGLEIVRGVRALAPALQREFGTELHLRIAVHTGLVVLDRGEVVGAAANEAARLHALAAPDTVLISDATHALVAGHFETDPAGEVTLAGVSRALRTFVVRAERSVPSPAALSPFTGREGELGRLRELWRSACADWERGVPSTPALLLTGGPGLGKSRLMRQGAQELGAPFLVCRCSSYHRTSSLYAFGPALEEICQITMHDAPEQRLAKLRERLGGDGDLPLLASALGIDPAALSAPPDVDPSLLRTRALEAAAELLRSRAAQAPTMLLVDDLHWADESALDLLTVLLAAPPAGLLIVLASRPGPEPRWPQLERLELNPLARAELEAMADALGELGDEQRDAVVERSDGVPLFLEELVRTDAGIPAALRDPLLARLALPGVDLRLAQLAATIGRDVDEALLRRLAELDDAAFERKLAQLVGVGLVEPSGAGTVRFRHELIREAAYETQQRATCRERHGAIADLLASGGFSSTGDAGRAAFHLERALRLEEAVLAYVAAARTRQSLGAHKEATADLTTALGLIERLPAGAESQRHELAVRQLRSFSAIMTGGYSAGEPAEDHARCVALCDALGPAPELEPSLLLSWSYYCSRGDLAAAERVCGAFDGALELLCRGVTSFFGGRFGPARELMTAFLETSWDGEWPLPNDARVAVGAHLVPALWICGDTAGAAAAGERALARTAELQYPVRPFSTAYLYSQLAVARRLEGDHAGAEQLALEVLAIGERHGFALWTFTGMIQHGLSRVHAGETAALAGVEAAVAQWHELLACDAWTPYLLTELAVAQERAERPEAALVSLDAALALAEETGSRFYSAVTLRVRGELRRRRGFPGGTEDLRAALELAREQRAPAFEWRAGVALTEPDAGVLAPS